MGKKKIFYVDNDELENISEDALMENYEYAITDEIPSEISEAYDEYRDSLNYD